MSNDLALPNARVDTVVLADDGTFPNNPRLPALVYRQALRIENSANPARAVEQHFRKNDWSNSWRDGVYAYHHYHSTTHEVLGCCQGEGRVQLGGPQGPILTLSTGDVLVIPAGVAHKRVEATPDFLVVGAYPGGLAYDMNLGSPDERREAEQRLAQVALPACDPVYGRSGPLIQLWDRRDQRLAS